MGTRCKTPGIKKELSGRALSLILRKKLSGFAFCFAPFFELCSQSTFTYGKLWRECHSESSSRLRRAFLPLCFGVTIGKGLFMHSARRSIILIAARPYAHAEKGNN